MSIKVQKLTKVYGRQKAINQISFEAKKGEILGFLGPNGAGKTTTMKIVTGFIAPTEGTAEVCGYDVIKNSLEVRAKTGYLPEHNPLYKDLYVKEYLSFIAGLYKVKNKRQRIDEMIERTGLQREQNKIIGSLSKGYRQRVGLAQAMLHDPEVLILDEPTAGLDPNQLVGIRRLIKDLGKEKALLFSTHIMQEVQALCDRVLIIDKGKLVADDSIEMLQQRIAGETVITVEFVQKTTRKKLEKIPHLKRVKSLGNGHWQLVCDKNKDIRAAIFEFAVANQLTLLEMKRETFSVENVFQELTK